MNRWWHCIDAALLGCVGSALLGVGVAAADTSTAPPGCSTWTVPSGVSSVHIDAMGAKGGGATGGAGAEESGTLGVTHGETLYLCVDSGGGAASGSGGAGGGESGVSTNSAFAPPVLVAAGGGGSAAAGSFSGAGAQLVTPGPA